jgi:hypothetical protein
VLLVLIATHTTGVQQELPTHVHPITRDELSIDLSLRTLTFRNGTTLTTTDHRLWYFDNDQVVLVPVYVLRKIQRQTELKKLLRYDPPIVVGSVISSTVFHKFIGRLKLITSLVRADATLSTDLVDTCSNLWESTAIRARIQSRDLQKCTTSVSTVISIWNSRKMTADDVTAATIEAHRDVLQSEFEFFLSFVQALPYWQTRLRTVHADIVLLITCDDSYEPCVRRYHSDLLIDYGLGL